MEVLIQLGFLLLLIIIGYTAGSIAEKKHYKSIKLRESLLLNIPTLTTKRGIPESKTVQESYLVSGSVVISIDYFKRILAGLRNIVGGEVSSYETLLDRARREAILRMKESANKPDMFLNMRIETSSVSKGGNKNQIGSVEVYAYSTAIKFAK